MRRSWVTANVTPPTAGAGIVLGQRGRGAPVAVLRGVAYQASDEGVASMLHQ
ncbi:MAG: hypothetical protein HYR62_09625 [Actinobacteria bacterium]|nr:hypothetical protein [Actinomycetota bacterium]MBI3687986.1 hypothetical protein [Actinomycetota bacterium]